MFGIYTLFNRTWESALSERISFDALVLASEKEYDKNGLLITFGK